MGKYSPNKPLVGDQVQKLPLGFTPTSVGITGQELKRVGRNRFPRTNRKNTAGRVTQLVPIYRRDDDGNLPVDAEGQEVRDVIGTKKIWHKRYDRLMNV